MTTDRLAFILARIILKLSCLLFMVAAALSTDSICDLDLYYPIRNGSRIIGCIPCRFCHPGIEPTIPCGTEIDNNQSVGNCRPCRNGTFSPAYDQKPCRICQKPKCLEHEIVLQNCSDTFDKSRCSGICDKGFVMNKEKTQCKMYEPPHKMTSTAQPEPKITTSQADQITPHNVTPRPMQKNTTITTEQLQQNTTTRSPVRTSDETQEKAVLPVVAIVFIVIGSLVVTVILIVAVCWYLCKMNRMDPRANKSCNGSADASRELLAGKEIEKLIKEEEGKENAIKIPQCETGFGADASYADASSTSQVPFGMQESVMSERLQSPLPALPFQQPETMDDTPVVVVDPGRPDILEGNHAAPPGPPRVGGLRINAETYEKICILLSDETVQNNWKMLAGRMHYDIDKVKQFTTTAKWHNEYPADVLLDHWNRQSAANDVAKLKELAGQIERNDIVQLLEH